jgi:hypothetical protein
VLEFKNTTDFEYCIEVIYLFNKTHLLQFYEKKYVNTLKQLAADPENIVNRWITEDFFVNYDHNQMSTVICPPRHCILVNMLI